MALLTWCGDVSLLHTAGWLWGPRAASGTGWCLASSWCLFYCGSRTLANTAEMALLAVALRWYPWRVQATERDGRWRKGDEGGSWNGNGLMVGCSEDTGRLHLI